MHALVLSAAAGLSTGLGGLIVFLVRRPSARMMSFSQGFAGGVMISVSLSDLLPEVWHAYTRSMGHIRAGLASAVLCALGMLSAFLLTKLLPEPEEISETDSGMRRTAFAVTAAVMLHNLPEGILTLFTGYASPKMGMMVALAVAMHNIPEGIAIAVPECCAGCSRGRAAMYALLSGLAEPAGALIAFFFLRGWITPLFISGMMAVIAGVMIWVSAAQLFVQAFSLGCAQAAAVGITTGVLVMSIGICLV